MRRSVPQDAVCSHCGHRDLDGDIILWPFAGSYYHNDCSQHLTQDRIDFEIGVAIEQAKLRLLDQLAEVIHQSRLQQTLHILGVLDAYIPAASTMPPRSAEKELLTEWYDLCDVPYQDLDDAQRKPSMKMAQQFLDTLFS